MVGQVFFPPYRHAQLVYLEPHLVTARKRKDGLCVVRRIIEVKYLFRYRVQGNERLHVGLLAVDADVTPAVSSRANPLEDMEYEKKPAPKHRHISRAELKAILETPMLDPLQELGRRAFLFSIFTGLAYYRGQVSVPLSGARE